MSENKSVRTKLQKLYGKGCMFKNARIAEIIDKIGGIKTYKKYMEEKKYKLNKVKRLEKKLHYHHLIHKSENGKNTIENGAVINKLAHQYIHSLPREQEEVINDILRDYKIFIADISGNGVNQAESYIPDFTDTLDIPLIQNERTELER